MPSTVIVPDIRGRLCRLPLFSHFNTLRTCALVLSRRVNDKNLFASKQMSRHSVVCRTVLRVSRMSSSIIGMFSGSLGQSSIFFQDPLGLTDFIYSVSH